MKELFLNTITNYLAQSRADKKLHEKEFGKKISKTLTFKYVELDEKYRKKWNVHSTDFGHLYKDDKKISDTLYRIGGFGFSEHDGYFMLLKQVEDYYDDSITKEKDKKPHLNNCSCILNKDGEEKVVCNQFDHPYLSGGVVYSLKNYYYNIETNELYCNSYTSMDSDEFVFIDNRYDEDKLKRGVMKINKTDGSYELFKSSK